jgi:hypothetical protein
MKDGCLRTVVPAPFIYEETKAFRQLQQEEL